MSYDESADQELLRDQLHTLRERAHVMERRIHDIETGQYLGTIRADGQAIAITEIKEQLGALMHDLGERQS